MCSCSLAMVATNVSGAGGDSLGGGRALPRAMSTLTFCPPITGADMRNNWREPWLEPVGGATPTALVRARTRLIILTISDLETRRLLTLIRKAELLHLRTRSTKLMADDYFWSFAHSPFTRSKTQIGFWLCIKVSSGKWGPHQELSNAGASIGDCICLQYDSHRQF